ncbi:acetoacetate decarboxylase family protein [Phenylobacterium sp.]|uniref:acetoacetate decarboxylase family protein n=1 Tax=Phenylobacterium sp. TaxID=1871053 RepID=UPI00286B6F5F|nr:acetoacetate decarboxylase family protein [Phenylobacterium sp.]
MPAHRPQSQVGPWFYRDTECMVIEFETDAEAALAVLPSDLVLVEPATGFMVIETNHWTTLGPYSEVYLGILCTYQGAVYGYVPGVYVTGENSQIVGREVFGFGKKRPDRIELISHGNGTVEAIMDVLPGDRALRAQMMASKNEPAEALAGLPLLCLRIVPDAEGGPAPALAQLIEANFKAEPLIGADGRAEVFSGPGHMALDGPSDVQFPVKKVTKAVYAHFNAVLPYPKIVKTYSQDELKGCV